MQKKHKILIMLLGRLLIGLVFAYSGYTKLMEPVENFQGAIAAYAVVPYIAVPVIARVIPWIEFIFGAMVLAGYMTRVSSLVLALMSISFISLILSTKLTNGTLPADCGCFGEGSIIHLKPWQVFALDVVTAFSGLKLFFTKSHPLSLDSLFSKPEKVTGPRK